MSREAPLTTLIGAASGYYRACGHFAQHFARGKLTHDPAYRTILRHGLLTGRSSVLDLGCGQGLLAAWLLAVRTHHTGVSGVAWPEGWPAPPLLSCYRGVDINRHEVARARRALARDAAVEVHFVHGDIRDVDYARADAVVIFDVLHYLDAAAQEQVLQRVRGALSADGLLLLRIGDAAAGAPHRLGQALDQGVALLRRGRWVQLACRALADWQQLLSRCGFRARAVPLAAGGGFANVLLRAQAA